MTANTDMYKASPTLAPSAGGFCPLGLAETYPILAPNGRETGRTFRLVDRPRAAARASSTMKGTLAGAFFGFMMMVLGGEFKGNLAEPEFLGEYLGYMIPATARLAWYPSGTRSGVRHRRGG
jgi:hypothetical protein